VRAGIRVSSIYHHAVPQKLYIVSVSVPGPPSFLHQVEGPHWNTTRELPPFPDTPTVLLNPVKFNLTSYTSHLCEPSQTVFFFHYLLFISVLFLFSGCSLPHLPSSPHSLSHQSLSLNVKSLASDSQTPSSLHLFPSCTLYSFPSNLKFCSSVW
jgi:hypothetical protein